MECNRDDALRSKEIALNKLSEKDIYGANKFALKALNLFPELEGLPQLLATLDIYISSQKKINGEVDWYGVLGVDPSANEDTIRKNYRKLALILHPDKNKIIGADGAFKILSEAWSLLSDKSKKSLYDHKRNLKTQVPIIPTRTTSTSKNGFFHNTNNTTHTGGNMKKPMATQNVEPRAPQMTKQFTFWTACNRCRMQYEYLRAYLNHTLLCPNCKEPFVAVETAPPPLNDRKASTPWASYKHYQNLRNEKSSSVAQPSSESLRKKPPVSENPGLSNFSHLYNRTIPHGSKTAPSPSTSTAAHTFAQIVHDKMKRGYEDGSAPSNGERLVKKPCIDEHTLAAKIGFNNEISSTIPPLKKNTSEPIRANNSGNSTYSFTREISGLDLRKLLAEKARSHICKKLSELKHSVVQNISRGAAGEQFEVPTTCLKNTVNQTIFADSTDGRSQKKLHAAADGDSTPLVPDLPAMSVPDPDFHDFDKDRTEKSFGENQVWAAYDVDDGMPRFYAIIHGVISLKPFRMRISWLNSKSNIELSPINWIGSGFFKTCGDFRIGKHEMYSSLNSFSHKVKWKKGIRGAIQIYPGKGEVWALYRNWSPDWNEFTSDQIIHKYDMVEVINDFDNTQGVSVIPLTKVDDFRTVFRRNDDPTCVRTIPREELFRFSHQVPSHFLTGEEASNVPEGSMDLDPAATPLDLFNLEKNEAKIVHDTMELKETSNSDVAVNLNQEQRKM